MSNSSENQRQKWREEKRQRREANAAKPLTRFPSKFFEILAYFEMHEEKSEQLSVRMKGEQQAQSIKFMWYDFKKALKSPTNTTHTGWGELSERLLLRVRGETLTFIWRDLDDSLAELNAMEIPFSGKRQEGTKLEMPFDFPANTASDDNDAYSQYVSEKAKQIIGEKTHEDVNPLDAGYL